MGAIFGFIFDVLFFIVKIIIFVIELIFKIMLFILKFLFQIFPTLFKVIAYLFKAIISGIGNLFSFVIKGIGSLWKIIAYLFKAIISGIGKLFSLIGKGIGSLLKFISSLFKTITGGTKVATATKVAVGSSGAILSSTTSTLTQPVKNVSLSAEKAVIRSSENLVRNVKILPSSSKKIFKVRRITKLEKKFIKSGKEVKFLGKVAVKRNFIFDSKAKDALGRTNIDRMKQGLAPIGKDGKPIELHHLKQQNNGKIVELLNTEHKNHSKILHRYTDKSEINRNEFNKWKKQYWKERAKDFE